jgi:hypothetical protein
MSGIATKGDRTWRRRRVVAIGVAVTVVAAAGVALAAASRQQFTLDHPVNRQVFRWQSADLRTSSQHWKPVSFTADGSGPSEPAGSPVSVYTNGAVSVSVNGNVAHAPIEVRVRDTGKLAHPHAAGYAPRSNSKSFSYTFVGRGHDGPCRNIALEWRSPTGQSVVLRNINIVVTYHEGNGSEGGAVCS